MFFGVRKYGSWGVWRFAVLRIMNEELGIRSWGEGFGFGLIVELRS
jgi:hypothetical protein